MESLSFRDEDRILKLISKYMAHSTVEILGDLRHTGKESMARTCIQCYEEDALAADTRRDHVISLRMRCYQIWVRSNVTM